MTDAFMHQHRTLVGPWRFISGSICPSNPFERHRRFTRTSKRAAGSQNFCHLSNTDAPPPPPVPASMGHFAGTSLALERKRKEAFKSTGCVQFLSELPAG